MNVGTKMTAAGAFNHIKTLEQVVADFRTRYGEAHHDVVVDFVAKSGDLDTAIDRAVAGKREDGKAFGMESCISKRAKAEFAANLKKIKTNLTNATDFDALYGDVYACAVRGIGHVVTYNVTMRLGAWLGPSVFVPKDYLYLHAGPLAGWKRLTGETGIPFRVPWESVPAALRVLSPRQVEDLLCEYRDLFKLWSMQRGE